MPDDKISALPSLASLTSDDLFVMVDDPAGTAVTKKMAGSVLEAKFLETAGDTATGAMVLQNSLTIETANGVDVNPGSDADADLLTVGVTGTPVLKWDEDMNAFNVNAGLSLDNNQALLISESGGTYKDVLKLTTSDNLALRTPTANKALLFYNSAWGVLARLDDSTGNLVIGLNSAGSGQLHVDQASATGAKPVLYLDQADVSEEMIEFNTTIGVGNAIEAVGGKTLTTTHFIKVTLPGGLTRYIPAGTIA